MTQQQEIELNALKAEVFDAVVVLNTKDAEFQVTAKLHQTERAVFLKAKQDAEKAVSDYEESILI